MLAFLCEGHYKKALVRLLLGPELVKLLIPHCTSPDVKTLQRHLTLWYFYASSISRMFTHKNEVLLNETDCVAFV